MPEISIIVPVYNVEKYIRRCIDSLVSQTLDNIEIILIDDGSQDNSGNICDEYALKDSRIKTIHKTNGGVSSARNVGLDNAQGTYIMFCDPDDYVASTLCSKLHKIISYPNPNIMWCVCGYERIDANSGKILRIVNPVCNKDKAFFSLKTQLPIIDEHALFCKVWGSIFKYSFIKSNNIRFDETLSCSEDVHFVLQYLLHTENAEVGVISETLYYYSTCINSSLTHNHPENFWEIELRWFNEYKKLMQKNNIPFCVYSNRYYERIINSALESINDLIISNFPAAKIFKRGNSIINSPECKKAFKYGKFEKVHPVYKAILRTRCFALIWMFNKIVSMKHSLSRLFL